jgi:hypothetical protein
MARGERRGDCATIDATFVTTFGASRLLPENVVLLKQ